MLSKQWHVNKTSEIYSRHGWVNTQPTVLFTSKGSFMVSTGTTYHNQIHKLVWGRRSYKRIRLKIVRTWQQTMFHSSLMRRAHWQFIQPCSYVSERTHNTTSAWVSATQLRNTLVNKHIFWAASSIHKQHGHCKLHRLCLPGTTGASGLWADGTMLFAFNSYLLLCSVSSYSRRPQAILCYCHMSFKIYLCVIVSWCFVYFSSGRMLSWPHPDS